jgi:transcriptional regulatory protein RtcR
MHEDFIVDELVLLHDRQHRNLVDFIREDAAEVSPQTTVSGYKISIRDPWDFAEVYGALYDFVKTYPFDTEKITIFCISLQVHTLVKSVGIY